MQHLFYRRHLVPRVLPVQVHIVCLQSLQRPFQRTVHVLAPVAAGIRIARLRVERKLGRKHQLVAQLALGNVPAHELFAHTLHIHIRRVDEVAARPHIGVKNTLRLGIF